MFSKTVSRVICCLISMLVVFVTTGFAGTTIKLGHFGPGPDPFSKSMELFSKMVAERSNGSMTVKIFPSGQLGSEKQQISALQGGLQEMLITASTNVTNMNNKLKLLDLPFVFADYAEADAVTIGPLARKMLAGMDKNRLVPLGLWENGFRAMTNTVHEIRTLKDFKGLKIRVIGSPIFIDTFKALGSQPVPMPFPELYSAMETGTVDGQDNPGLSVQALKFYEVQKYYTNTNHIYGAMIVLVGKPFYSRLSQKNRVILEQAVLDFGIMQRKILRDAGDKAVDFLATKGHLKVVPKLTPETVAEIRAAVRPVVEAAVTDDIRPLYQEMLQTIKAVKQ